MFKKNAFIIITHLLICIFLSSCSDQEYNDKVVDISGNTQDVLAYTVLNNDSYIYINVENETAVFYKHYIKESITETIGVINNFYLNTKDAILIDNRLYLYASVFDESNINGYSNILYEMNLSNNSITSYKNHDNSLAGIPTQHFNGNIITLKNVLTDNVIETYLETFDINTKKFYKSNVNEYNTTTKTGSAIFGLYGDKDFFYILYDDCNKENIISYLKIYNNNFEEIESIKIEKEIRDYIFATRVIEMAVFEKILYIRNISNYSLIAKIDNNMIEPILMERNIELATNQLDPLNPFFYKRNSNNCYTVDFKTGDLVNFELEIHNDYSIMSILANKQNIMLICYADDKDEYIYYLDKERLGDTLILCE